MGSKRRLFVSDIAEAAKLSPASIRKLADAGRIKSVRRDYNGWRIFSEEAIEEVRRLAGTQQ
jgi:DNA-binding transcriptional MerR regulator